MWNLKSLMTSVMVYPFTSQITMLFTDSIEKTTWSFGQAFFLFHYHCVLGRLIPIFGLRTKGVRIWIGASLVLHKKAGLHFLYSDFSIYKRMSWSGNSNWFTIGTKKTSELEPRKTPLKIKIDNASLSVRFYWIIGDLTKMWKTLIYGSHSLPRERP